MIVYPAMDLMDGRCVRLTQGRFDDATVYPDDPAEALARFAEAGASWAHVVDLDGARKGRPVQHDLIAGLAEASRLKLQVGGGVRTRDQVARLIDAGVGRVVLGSAAVGSFKMVLGLFREFGNERIALALDVSCQFGVPRVVMSGWTETSALTVDDLLGRYADARHLLVTDVGQDGMLSGPNLGLVNTLVQDAPAAALQASGGIAAICDLVALKYLGAAGAVIGKALWEGRIDLKEAIEIAGA